MPVDLDGGRPAVRSGADRGARSGGAGAERRPHRLHRRARAAPACARRSPRTTASTTAIDVSPERIAVTTGSSAAFNLAFLAMFDVGDRVAIAAPGYPAYRNIMAALGIEVVEIELDGAGHLTAAHLADRARRKAAERRAVRQPGQSDRRGHSRRPISRSWSTTARELGIAAISDEIYHRLAYAAPDTTALVVRRRRRRSSTRSRNTIA